MSNIISQFIAKIISSAISFIYLFTGLKSGLKGEEIHTPEDFEPILRFIACSDVHLDGDENQPNAIRLKNLIEDMNKYSESQSYKSLDALMVVGDFAGGGAEEEYAMFNKIVNSVLKDETQLLTVLGNHEFINYRDVDASVGYDVYKKMINENVDTDVVINGYHFIGVSYDDNGSSFSGKTKWLRERLENATKEDPTKPVFVYQHPHPTLTVYGSINWSDLDIRKVLSDFPQVVDFSGHSHYSPSDPRSVWQGEFTAIACGSLKALMGNLNYIEGDVDAPGESAAAWVVEADKDGNVSLKLYDVENRIFFENIDYYFTNLSDSSKRAYTWGKQKSLDTAPEFPENASVKSTVNENSETVIFFPEAKGYYEAENYKITVKAENGKKFYEKTVISEYVRATDENVTVNIGKLEKGNYTVKVISYSPYAKKGQTLKNTITVE
ncbi:MAG: metallophosphoesterase [Clostridia bacterium]|nr:metallophosphoesterase [Clostridia bacterium]